MGASDWFYLADWAGSEDATLRRAQDELLASDEIFEIVGSRDRLIEAGQALLEYAELTPEFFDAEIIQQAIDQLGADGRPATREHAVLFCYENLGTGTILDVDGIRAEPRSGDDPAPWGYEGTYLSPLPQDEIIAIFGTGTPSPSQLDEHREKVAALHTFRGDGRYVVAYESGNPAKVAFVGASGD